MSSARRRVVENDLRDFRLSGADLPEERKPRFKEIQEELSALGAKFSENVLDATNAHAEWIEDEAGLAGLPDDAKAAARAAAEKDGESAKRAGRVEDEALSRLDGHRTCGKLADADLRSLQVCHHANRATGVLGGLTQHGDALLVVFRRAVGKIQAHHIDAGRDQFGDCLLYTSVAGW